MNRLIGPSVGISIRLIGPLRVERDGQVLTAAKLGSPKARQILEILALQLGRPVPREQIINILWRGNPPSTASATVESYVSVIRRNIQPGQAKNGPLRTDKGSYILDPKLVQVDLDLFERAIGTADGTKPAEAYPKLVSALELASAPLLSDELTFEWAESARVRHAAQVADCSARAAEMAVKLGKTDEAVRWARQAVAAEPLNERAWTALVDGLEQGTRYIEALQAYDNCRLLFRRELDCNPGPLLQAAHARLLHCTSDEDAELEEVLSALICLNERVKNRTGKACTLKQADGRDTTVYETAGSVIDSFLRRALASV